MQGDCTTIDLIAEQCYNGGTPIFFASKETMPTLHRQKLSVDVAVIRRFAVDWLYNRTYLPGALVGHLPFS